MRLIKPARRVPATEVEVFVVAMLERETEMPFGELVTQVAECLYRKELRGGGWLLDLGLFGSRLFVADAKRALAGGIGKLWSLD